ncbi:MAG: calcium-binding protein [Pseudomonadota bacterium]
MATPTTWLPAFDVNVGTGTTGTQSDPQFIGLSNGNILAVYEASSTGTVGTGGGADIIGKLYDPNGFVIRNEFQINTGFQTGDQRDFDVAATNDGGFILAYTSDSGSSSRIVWERFDSDGDQVALQSIVSESGTGDLRDPKIVVDQFTNNAFVTWENLDASGDLNILGQYIGDDGTVLTTTFNAAQNSSDFDRDHETALLTTGELVTVKEEDDFGTQSMEIHIYNTAGVLQHSSLSTLPSGVTGNPQVAGLANGNFVVVWEDSGNINGRVYDNSATPIGAQFVIESSAANANEVRVVALPGPDAGDFVVVWDNDTDGRTEIRQFNADGTPDGSVVSAIGQGGFSPNVGVTVDGRILVTHVSQADGEIDAAIFDSRALGVVADDYANEPRNFLSGTVVTGRKQITDFVGNANNNLFFGQGDDDFVFGLEGNDTLVGGAGNDSLFGGAGQDSLRANSGDDVLSGGTGNDTLDGGTGSDTADFSYSFPLPPPAFNVFSSWTITLGTASDSAVFSSVFGIGEQDTLIGIENIVGSGWQDIVDLSAASISQTNRIETGDGDDRIIVSGLTSGNDFLDGGAGTDTLVIENPFFSGVTYDLAAEEVLFLSTKSADIISLENIEISGAEKVIGSAAANRISARDGTGGNNEFLGGDGNDTLVGGVGNDTLFGEDGDDLFIDNIDGGTTTITGGFGIDVLNLSGASQGVVGGPNTITAVTNGTVLSLSSIETFIGTDFADEINEGITFDNIALGGGNDTLSGTLDGFTDAFDGGDGIDTFAEFSNNSANIDLLNGVGGTLLDPTRVSLTNFENAFGGNGSDTVIGDNGANFLGGGEGSDLVIGSDGADTLDAGRDNDTVLGGAGNDLIFDALDNGTTEIDGGSDIDTLDLSSTTSGRAVGDTTQITNTSTGAVLQLTSIENLIGTLDDDNITEDGASGSFDSIDLESGNDVLNAIADSAADSFDGGGGIDLYVDLSTTGSNIDLLNEVAGTAGSPTLVSLRNFENVIGGSGNDTITGDSGVNFIGGGFGNDSISGEGGNDLIEGGQGNDTINGGDGNDLINQTVSGDSDLVFGDGGNDTIQSSGFDSVSGGDDDDAIFVGTGRVAQLDGGTGVDTLNTTIIGARYELDMTTGLTNFAGELFTNFENVVFGSGSDEGFGTAAANSMFGGIGNDRLLGLGGNDTINGAEGDDTVNGGLGNDQLLGGSGNDTVYGQDGDDLIIGEAGDDLLIGNEGNDTIDGGTGLNDIRGRQGDDSMSGGDDADVMFGGSGADTMIGAGGNDTLQGNEDNDLILGDEGNDRLFGQLGADTLQGGNGEDELFGGAGNDDISGEQGNDTIFGGSGQDTMFGDSGDDEIRGNQQNDSIEGGEGMDRLFGDDGFDFVGGGSGNDQLFGGNGNDTLSGDDGADLLVGGLGNDVLTGGIGVDILRGQGGADTFAFFSVLNSSASGSDLIDGFDGAGSFGGDVIDLLFIDADETTVADDAFTFLGASNLTSALAFGAGALWLEDSSGGQTLLRGLVNNDVFIDLEVRINDGATIAADYLATDFVL